MKIWFRFAMLFCLTVSASLSPSVGYANSDGPGPVLMVISNQDFWYQDYADTRASLEAQGLEVIVAAATTEVARPHAVQNSMVRPVKPDLALASVDGDDYSAIVFVGGYGAASYQYANETTYDNPAYSRDPNVVGIVNNLIGDFVKEDKPVAAICNGVSVLAWARVDGQSPINGRNVAAWAGGIPAHTSEGQSFPDNTVLARQEIEENGGLMVISASPGDPLATEDDVIVDGNIITAENYNSAALFGVTIANAVSNSPRKNGPRILRRLRSKD